MKLTEHFNLSEFTKSITAIKRGIDNIPTDLEIDSLKLLCVHILEPLRVKYNKPIKINSGYRSDQLNLAIGGNPSSQHCKGQAADIDTLSDNKILFDIIKNELPFDQLIWEYGNDKNPSWVHVSFKSLNTNRQQVLKCFKDNGQTKYITYE